MSKFVEVSKVSAIPDQSAICVEVEDQRIALFNFGGQFYAIDDTCPHRGGPLSEGSITGEEVRCPWHGAQFNIKSGEVTSPPSPTGVTKYNVRVSGDAIEIEV
jgi:NAD(P)H-dependent nitrite reductase small subunit